MLRPKPVMTPDWRPVGRVEMVNPEARFVVLSFRQGVPAAGEVLNINHRGLKIGEVKVTGPQRDTDTVADIIAGDAYAGDEASRNEGGN
jgi:hypothetical protein